MSDATRLERWYRRILTWYPAEHRRIYGDEMIGVLLASAPQGKRHPGIADTLDLIKGALLARLRPADGHADAGWRDTLAVFSIAAPVAAITYFLVTVVATEAHRLTQPMGVASTIAAFSIGVPLGVVAIATPPLLALAARLRWLAVATAAISAIAVGFFALLSFAIFRATLYLFSDLIWYSIFYVLEVVALAISPGTRRGAALMTRPAWAVTAGAAGLAGLATGLVGVAPIGTAEPFVLVTTLVAVLTLVIGLVLTLPAPIGARLLLLLAIPGYPTAIAMTGISAARPYGAPAWYSFALIYLPAIVFAGLVAVLAWRSSHRASQRRGSAAS